MKPTNKIYVGGPPLDPPDDDGVFCPHCEQEFWSLAELGAHICVCPDAEMEDPNDYPED